jgi:tRNA A-37 threonylcarbamoyl transferase component Bud32
VRSFHEAGGRHADLHVKNLLLRSRDGELEVFVIDLDKAHAGAPPDARRRMRELARLYRSLLKRGLMERVGEKGRGAFLSAYLAGDRQLGRALLRHWPAERRRVARHALGYDASR